MPKVAAVVPLYFPDSRAAERIAALRLQVDLVVAVDDGTVGQPADLLDQLERNGIRVIRHDDNRGIAAALNSGVEAALGSGADLVLTVDQDTQVPEGYVAACVQVFELGDVTDKANVGVVAAGSINGSAVIPHAWVDGIALVRYAIQSGLMISARCFRDCGLFDERLVIDAVDTEFCLRAWDHGYAVAAAMGTDLAHELGELMPARVFGIRRWRGGIERTYEYHAPFRQYYISRNGVDLALRYLRRDPRWAMAALRFNLVDLGVALAAGPRRRQHALAAIVGTAHGLVRRRGKLSPWWGRRLGVERR